MSTIPSPITASSKRAKSLRFAVEAEGRRLHLQKICLRQEGNNRQARHAAVQAALGPGGVANGAFLFYVGLVRPANKRLPPARICILGPPSFARSMSM